VFFFWCHLVVLFSGHLLSSSEGSPSFDGYTIAYILWLSSTLKDVGYY